MSTKEEEEEEVGTMDEEPNNNGDTENGTTEPTSTEVTKKQILLQDDDEDEEEMDIDEASQQPQQQQQQQQQSLPPSASTLTNKLIPQIITPSPFQHHNDSATSERYRNALQRISHSPLHDVEAWEAIMTECMSLYRTQLLPLMEEERKLNFNTMTAAATTSGVIGGGKRYSTDLEKKLDWVESCHGHILHFFPYTASYYCSILEVLFAKYALSFESLTTYGEDDYQYIGNFGRLNTATSANSTNAEGYMTNEQIAAEKKMENIFEFVLGVKMDGTAANPATSYESSSNDDENNNIMEDNDNDNKTISPQALLGGMCTSSVELWLLYIHKRSRDAKRFALLNHLETNNTSSGNSQQQSTKLTSEGEELIRDWIIGAYETALSNGVSFVYNNDIIWKQYLTYVKSWNIMTTNPLNVSEVTINHMLHSKQKELLRSIYQRIVMLPMTGLDTLWNEYEAYEKAQSEELAAKLIPEYMPKYQHARSVYLERNRVFNIHELRIGKVATPPADYGKESFGAGGSDKESIKSKIIEEMELLSKWKKRCSYERTNPERLSNADLAIRIRQCFKDTICAFMRHIEVWHEWSMWELYNSGTGSTSATSAAANNVQASDKKRNVQYSIAVLSLAQTFIPDCTLLAYSHAMILENQVSGEKGIDEAIEVLTQFCNRAGNTLAYVLLQRLVRKYKGMKEARIIFASARRALRIKAEDISDGTSSKVDGKSSDLIMDQGIDKITNVKTDGSGQDSGAMTGSSVNESKKRIVMTRETFEADEKSRVVPNTSKNYVDANESSKYGFITWHLYASHATMEHRINKLPEVAARVYELGLRKHRTFLATPQYVLQYCSLLLELGDEANLRALLTRAIAACEEECEGQVDESVSSGNQAKSNLLKKKEKQRPLWDMMLMFESIVSARSGDRTSLRNVEARRRIALFGPEHEDVSGGSFLNENEVSIGMQKISLNDTLIRVDGYDVSSMIVNGLDRIVDTLEISGVLGNDLGASMNGLGAIWKDDGAGGLSDSSFRRRKRLQAERAIIRELSVSGSDLLRNTALETRIAGASSGKLLSAKERLAQSAMQSQTMTVAAAVLSSPEWLRDMLTLLPATSRNFRGAKAPPHLIEMALAALRDNSLPARPSESQASDISPVKRKRKLNDDGDSSDEEDGTLRGGGYANQFKARQKAKLASSHLGAE